MRKFLSLGTAIATISLLSFAIALNNTSESREKSSNTGKILGFTAVGAGIAGLVWHRSKTNRPNLNLRENALWIDRANPRLQKKLLKLIRDRQTANRLIAGVKFRYPDRDVDWLAEKVTYDLERDRL